MQVHHRGAGVHCWGAHQAWCKGVVLFWMESLNINSKVYVTELAVQGLIAKKWVSQWMFESWVFKNVFKVWTEWNWRSGQQVESIKFIIWKKTDMLFLCFFIVINLKPFSEDNCPWAAIASLALHKLFTDWQSQGYTLPKVYSKLWYEIFSHVQLVKLLGTWKSASRFWFFKWRRRT